MQEFESDRLLETLATQFDIENGATGKNSATMFTNYKETSIKTDFLCHNYPLLKPINTIEGVNIYSLEDIAAMKLNAVANRGAKKDFHDIDSLLDRFSMGTMLNFYREKYRQMNDPDKLVKRSNRGWLSKKLHMRGAYFLFNFGVLGYVVIK